MIGPKIYILKAKDPSFTGFVAGVDFYEGTGSTTSLSDVARIVELGVADVEDPETRATIDAYIVEEREKEAIGEASKAIQADVERQPGYMGTRPAPRRRSLLERQVRKQLGGNYEIAKTEETR